MQAQVIGAIYARDSRDDGDEAFGLDNQIRKGLEYAAKHGITVPEAYIFADEFTGTEFSRPEFNKVKRLIENGKIDAVIALKVNRISRIDYHSTMFLREYIFKHRIDLHIVQWGRRVENNKNDSLLFNMESQFGHFERDDILERTSRGRREKAEQGIFLGQGFTPYGYSKEGTKKNTRLYIIEEEANVIRLIFSLMVNDCMPMGEIARYLTAKGVTPPAVAKKRLWQKSEWNHSAILRILRDSRYVGDFYAFKYIKSETSGRMVLRDKEQWIKQSFPELAIVDRELFDAAQGLIDVRRDRYTFVSKYDRLLAKRLTCLCEKKIGTNTQNVSRGKPIHYYRCGIKHTKRGEWLCDMPHVRSEILDAQVWDRLEALIRNPELELEQLQQAQQKQAQQHTNSLGELEAVEKFRAEYNQELNELYQDYKDKLITKDIYLQRKQPLDERLEAAEQVYREIREAVDAKVLSNGEIQRIIRECHNLANILDEVGSLDFDQKLRVVELLGITGRFVVENGALVLVLAVHNFEFDGVSVRESLYGDSRPTSRTSGRRAR